MKKFLLITILGTLFLAQPMQTYACSCAMNENIRTSLAQTDYVFSGRVISTKSVYDRFGTNSYQTRVDIEVDKTWKGISPEAKEITVLTSASSASCGYEFSVGEKYLIFANGEENSSAKWVSLCSSTQPYSSAYTSGDISKLGAPLTTYTYDPQTETADDSSKRQLIVTFSAIGLIAAALIGKLLIETYKRSDPKATTDNSKKAEPKK
ncbi:MAG: hypothetical protein Fur003_4820 [Candidatus Dojkabacteria bacterium]